MFISETQPNREIPLKIGLIINPVAGIGGRVGLKGSDGQSIQRLARALGAVPEAQEKAIRTLKRLVPYTQQFTLVTYPAEMGEEAARQAGIEPWVIGNIRVGKTTARDTQQAVRRMSLLGVDLLLFAGGDGTAGDIHKAIGKKMLVLGIPSGVKMYSGVFATTPEKAGEVVQRFLDGQVGHRLAEVIDLDEQAFRQDKIVAQVTGNLKIPDHEEFIQSAENVSATTENTNTLTITQEVLCRMEPGRLWIFGPGNITHTIAMKLGLQKTLLGVDVFQNHRLIAKDVGEGQLLELLNGHSAKILLTPTGKQGFILGRNNQPISPTVIRKVGIDNLVLASTAEVIQSLRGAPLRVDSGDPALDRLLEGSWRVITGRGEEVVYTIAS